MIPLGIDPTVDYVFRKIFGMVLNSLTIFRYTR